MTAVEPRPASLAAAPDIGAFAYFEGSVVPIERREGRASRPTPSTTARPCSRAFAPTARTTARSPSCSRASTTSGCCATLACCARSVPEIARARLRRDHARPAAPQRARRRRLHPAARLQVRAQSSASSSPGSTTGSAIFTMPLGDYLPTGGIRRHRLGLAARQRQRHPRPRQDQRLVRQRRVRGRGRARRRLRRRHPADRRRPRGRGIGREPVRRAPATRSPRRPWSMTSCPASRAAPSCSIARRRRLRRRRAPHRPIRAVPRRRGVPHRHRRPGRADRLDRRPAGRHRRVPGLARHPAPLLRGRARHRPALRALAHPDLTASLPRRSRPMTLSPPEPNPASTADGLRLERWSATQRQRARQPRQPRRSPAAGIAGARNADGNGAVDALMRAVDNALAPLLGDGVTLVSYDVHAAGPATRRPGLGRRSAFSAAIGRTDRSTPVARSTRTCSRPASAAYVDAVEYAAGGRGRRHRVGRSVARRHRAATRPIPSTDPPPRIGSCRPTTTEGSCVRGLAYIRIYANRRWAVAA